MRKLGLGFLVVALGCGGEDAIVDPGGDASSDVARSGDSTIDGNSVQDANNGDVTTPPGDGGGGDAANADGGIPPNGTPPDPGKVACGNTSCTTAQSCCVTPTPDGGAAQACGGGCNQGAQLECDEAKDCPPAVLPDGGTAPQVCCYERAGNAIVGASCHRDCTGGGGNRVQACRTNGECLTGSCAVRSCTGTIKSVETCNPITNVCP